MECSSSRKREGNASFRSVSGTTTACSMCIFHSEKNEKPGKYYGWLLLLFAIHV